MSHKLTPEAHTQALSSLEGWEHDAEDDAISKSLQFADFKEAFAFMTQVAMEAEKIGHHPDWCNAYNQVHVVLTTHDVEGLSERDIELARYIDRIAQQH